MNGSTNSSQYNGRLTYGSDYTVAALDDATLTACAAGTNRELRVHSMKVLAGRAELTGIAFADGARTDGADAKAVCQMIGWLQTQARAGAAGIVRERPVGRESRGVESRK